MSCSSYFRRLTAAVLVALSFIASPAFAGDVILDNLTSREDRGLTRIARVEVINSNLSADEVRRLLETTGDEKIQLELLSRLKADRMTINGLTFSGDDGTMIFAPIMMSGIDQGRVARITLDGVDMDLRMSDTKGTSQLKVRALEIERADFASLLKAVLAGRPEDIDFRAEKFVWAGFEWSGADENVKATAPGGNRMRISLAGVNATTQYEGAMPVRSVAEINGLSIELPPTSEGGQAFADMGYKKLEFSLAGQMRYDPLKRDLMIENYALTGVNVGRLMLSGTFGNIDPSLLSGGVPEQKLAALMLANISQIDIRFVNEGAVENGFAYAASQQGKSAPALRSEASMIVGQMLPMLLGGDPAALPLARSAQDFLRESKNFTLSLKSRGAPVPVARLSSISDPSTFFALVDVQLKSNQ